MRLHVIEDDFPLLIEELDNDGEAVFLDSPTLHNLELGDQIQTFSDLETWVYIVVDVKPADIPEIPGSEEPGAKYVTLRNVYWPSEY